MAHAPARWPVRIDGPNLQKGESSSHQKCTRTRCSSRAETGCNESQCPPNNHRRSSKAQRAARDAGALLFSISSGKELAAGCARFHAVHVQCSQRDDGSRCFAKGLDLPMASYSRSTSNNRITPKATSKPKAIKRRPLTGLIPEGL